MSGNLSKNQLQPYPTQALGDDEGDRLFTAAETARFLNVSERCLENWRVRGGGPKYLRLSRRCVRYRRRAMWDFLDERAADSTSGERAVA